MVSRLDCGVASYGIIHEIEVAADCPVAQRPDVRQSLVDACVSWLQERGTNLVYARTVDRGAQLAAMLRYSGSREWVLDPETGAYVDIGPAGEDESESTSSAHPGPLPMPIQAARVITN
jgi:hypothetical protein